MSLPYDARVVAHAYRRGVVPVVTDGNHGTRVLLVLPALPHDPRYGWATPQVLLVTAPPLDDNIVKGQPSMRMRLHSSFFGSKPVLRAIQRSGPATENQSPKEEIEEENNVEQDTGETLG